MFSPAATILGVASKTRIGKGLAGKTEDGIPENVPRVDGKVITPVPLTDKTNAGNMVALKIGEGQYAFYAHLQPGSLRVKVGDRVRKAQVLGKVGNSATRWDRICISRSAEGRN